MAIFELDGRAPQLPDGVCFIAESACVIGNVILGADVSIWFGAVLRGDNEPMKIGEGTNIQDNAVLHSDPGSPLTIGAGCTLGHKAMVHGCTIGENTLIGMNATVLNDTVVGRNCIIGAGALIPERKEIPDNSLVVGTPGRVVRTLDDAAVERIRRTAQHYVANGRRFAAGLKRIG